MRNIADITQRAVRLYRDNDEGFSLFLSYCLGIMRGKMDKEDLALMEAYLDKRFPARTEGGAAALRR